MKKLFKTKKDRNLFIIFIAVILLFASMAVVGITSHYKQKENPELYKH